MPSVASTTSPKISYSKKRKSLSLEWFYNLPVKGKQLTGLFTFEVISIVGLVGVGAVLIVAAPNQVVTGRAVAGTQSYTIAAKALSDVNGNPVAVLVRGTEETALNKLLGDSLLLQLAVSALTLVVETTNKAKVLDESSQEIAKVVNLVQEISLKTRNCK